jgi:3-oxoacyl-[acyl-carrier protein] reductase
MHWSYLSASAKLPSDGRNQIQGDVRRTEENDMKKTAIVTGASRGIGRAVAKRLAKDGFGVVVNYLSNAGEAEQVVSEMQRIGGNAIAVKADVANQTDVERLFEETTKKFGSVDVVVHNS